MIPSYNNQKWCDLNITSVLTQDYDNFSIIYIDDCSSDDTYEKVRKKVCDFNAWDKVTLIRNQERHGALYNLYHAIHSCADSTIIMTVDGDDWLPHPYVLQKVNEEYQNPGVWLTYGQYIEYPNGAKGWSSKFPQDIIENNKYRDTDMPVSHLRTFYAGLFKAIKTKDLLYEGDFYPMTWDKAIMIPMMEMAGGRFKALVNDILYVYNNANPINDHKVNQAFQFMLHRKIKNKEAYSAFTGSELASFYETINQRKKIGLLIVATGKYISFVSDLLDSARKFFCNGHEVHFFVFTDSEFESQEKDVSIIHQERLGWPFDTMMRPVMYYKHFNEWKDKDYVYSIDADMRFVNTVGDEILYDLVATQHPGFIDEQGPFENRSASTAYVELNEYIPYLAGGFWGGKTENILNFLHEYKVYFDLDNNNNIIPIWHDESYLNRYFATNKPSIILTPSYCYPETHQKKIPFDKKIMALDKNHAVIRA